MWLSLAFASAMLLGLYDAAKKSALRDNAVIPVLLLNTIFCSLIFLPPLLSAELSLGWFDGTVLSSTQGSLHEHLLIVAKSALVLSSWIFGYYAIKHLPLTIVGPINSIRPILVLIGAMTIFGERPNLWQWAGIALALLSLYLLSRSSRRDGIDFRRNVWIWALAAATLLGAASGLYDKFVVSKLNPVFVQSWFCVYQAAMMTVIAAAIWYPDRHRAPLKWNRAIPLISVFICCADFCYYQALSRPEAMISIVSMIRHSSVIVSFACGALLFGERNLRAKFLDLLLILAGMVLLYIGRQ